MFIILRLIRLYYDITLDDHCYYYATRWRYCLVFDYKYKRSHHSVDLTLCDEIIQKYGGII